MDIIGVVRDSLGPYFAIYGIALTCRHDCTHDCKEYNIRRDGRIVERTHGGVVKNTWRRGKAPCHSESPCQLCMEPCKVTCVHSECSKLGGFSWSCPHRGRCSLPCAVPCDLLPCPERVGIWRCSLALSKSCVIFAPGSARPRSRARNRAQ
jgi:hypothetical protein